MNWYKDNKVVWREIIETIANELNRNPIIIEKDLIQSMFLFEISKINLPFVFKGGTSLSKAYNLIDRFSEDIDLSMSRKITQSEKKLAYSSILDITNKLGLELINEDNIQSRYDYNKYVLLYESLFSKTKLEIVIETNYYQSAYPVIKKSISNFVNNFCTKNSIVIPITFECQKFEMHVQSLERTFIDKVFAICDYRIQNKTEGLQDTYTI